jgi:hypothetical protein
MAKLFLEGKGRHHIGADPRGDPEHVFDEAAKATMRCGVAALGLAAAAGRRRGSQNVSVQIFWLGSQLR